MEQSPCLTGGFCLKSFGEAAIVLQSARMKSKKSRGCHPWRGQVGALARIRFLLFGVRLSHRLCVDQTGGAITPMTNPQGDQFVMLKIEGMHCHRCEQAIKKALAANPGVHEVEVDFLSGQA